MKLTITNDQLITLCESLHRLETTTGEAGWAIAQTISNIDKAYEAIMRYREKVLQKYGEATEDGRGYVIKDEKKRAQVIKELNTVLLKQVEIDITQVPYTQYSREEIKGPATQAADYRIFEQYMVEPDKEELS